MANVSDRMPKVDLDKDLTSEQKVQLDYIRRIQTENAARVAKLKKTRSRNILTGCLLTASVFGIFGSQAETMRNARSLSQSQTD